MKRAYIIYSIKMKIKTSVLSFLIVLICLFSSCRTSPSKKHPQQAEILETVKLADIPIRDPFILPVEEDGLYYLYSATRGELRGPNGRQGVCAYTSKDLEIWEGPRIVFEIPEGFWADARHGIWAPEVHAYRGKYYLFATFTNPADTIGIREEGFPIVLRGSQVLMSDGPLGPFKAFDKEKPITPTDWMSLDGTLWEEDGVPWMVFCHEWVQINEGTFERVKMNSSLSAFAGEPMTMFRANDAPWVKRMDQLGIRYHGQAIPGFVSDGPFLHMLPSGSLICLTSSFGEDRYSLSYALSESGKLEGPWIHPENPLLSGGHGHGMLFRSFDGRLMLTCHFPNSSPSTAVIYELEEKEDNIQIKSN